MDLGDLFQNDVVGSLTRKFGISPDQAKDALSKIIPFVKDKIAGKPETAEKAKAASLAGYAQDPSRLEGDDADGHGQELLSGVSAADQEAKIAEIARSTGLAPDVVRRMLPSATTATIGAMDDKGMIAAMQQQQHLFDNIFADAADGKVDGLIDGKPYKK